MSEELWIIDTTYQAEIDALLGVWRAKLYADIGMDNVFLALRALIEDLVDRTGEDLKPARREQIAKLFELYGEARVTTTNLDETASRIFANIFAGRGVENEWNKLAQERGFGLA